MLENYFPILLFIVVGAPSAWRRLGSVLSRLLGVHRPDSEKLSPYECGFEAFEDARMKFDVRYYLVAILFILFDLEIAFLFPWAVVLQRDRPVRLLGDDASSSPSWSSASSTSGRRARSNGTETSSAMARSDGMTAASWTKGSSPPASTR